ncbi:MAG: efflux RND transporter permease subunit [Candidatus Eisenbacteria bacterium]|nr:efflux RND transporter permease subunit [Candidatus Eisenbacteria bacterium]
MISRIIEFCARNRAAVIVGTVFACAGAWYSMVNTPVDAIPDLSDVQVIVWSDWMGRSPDLVEDQVTYPIVTALLSAPRVSAVRGYSMFGMSFVYVIFEEGADMYWARSRVLEYMKQFEGKLPQGVTPVIGPDASSVGWVYQYALVDRTGTHDLSELRTFQDFNLRYALASVPGVAEVASVGGYQKQYQVEVDPDKLRAYGLTIGDVSRAIRASNNDVGGRVIEMTEREYFVRGKGYVRSLDAIRQIGLGASGGTPILLDNVARVSFGPDIRRGVGELDGQGETVGGTVVMRHGENAREVIAGVKQRIDELRPSFPEGVELRTVYDRSNLIQRSIRTLKRTLVEEGIVVAAVIIIFLLHFGSAIVPIIALPVSVALAFIPMYLLGVNSNIMSLGGIAIAIGAMVDASIVLVENAHKRLENAPPHADRREVIIAAAKEVGPSIFYALLIITIGFLPIFALTGQGGRLFRPLAYTKTFAMFFASVVSITVVPALMVTFLRGRVRHEAKHPISRILIGLYKPFVYVALRNPKTTIAIGLAAIISAVPMVPKIGSEFMPPLNEGDILYMPTTLPNISIEAAKQYMQFQDRVIRSFPEVISVYGKAGRSETATDPAPLSMLETIVQLKPMEQWRKVPRERWYSGWAPELVKKALGPVWPEERRITWKELVAEFDKAMQMPGWTNAWTMPIKARIDMLSTGIRTPIGVKIFGNDLQEIEHIGLELERALSIIPSTRSVYSDRNTGGFFIDIIPDRAKIARYGLSMRDVQYVIEGAIGGMPIEVTVEGRTRFSINVRYPRALRENIDRLKEVLVPLPSGGAGGLSESMPKMGLLYAPAVNAPADGVMPERAPLRLAGGDLLVDYEAFSNVMAKAQMNDDMGTGSSAGAGSGSRVGGMNTGANESGEMPPESSAPPSGIATGVPMPEGRAHIPLGQIADVRIASGPPMIKDENGMLVGYVYVDMDQSKRDIGGYVKEAKQVVARQVKIPAGYYLKWTGQYELLEVMAKRMRVVIPITFILIILMLYLNFRNITETLIVLVSVPFALVGSIWLMYFLGYNYSTATLVGIIALVGLATQTGIVMILYLDHAYMRRKKAGKVRDLNDIIWAHMEGTVMRVRPKLMTVGTTMMGLLPLLWAQGVGADVMKRIAAPMVGGLISSTFLTLEVIPVIYTYWRLWQIRRERRLARDTGNLRRSAM